MSYTKINFSKNDENTTLYYSDYNQVVVVWLAAKIQQTKTLIISQ
jgi:hypothetical protein